MFDSPRFPQLLIGISAIALIASPAIAHTTQIAGDVAGTWHIEPNHTPKAGEPATAWIALTREGGQLLPLEAANCQLAVYRQPRQPTDAPVLEPPLAAIAAEQHQGIPGAKIVFPDVGIYELELSCTPKTEASFQPFEMQYEVTVAAGTPASNSEPPALEAESQNSAADGTSLERASTQPSTLWVGGLIVSAFILGLAGFLQFGKRLKH